MLTVVISNIGLQQMTLCIGLQMCLFWLAEIIENETLWIQNCLPISLHFTGINLRGF